VAMKWLCHAASLLTTRSHGGRRQRINSRAAAATILVPNRNVTLPLQQSSSPQSITNKSALTIPFNRTDSLTAISSSCQNIKLTCGVLYIAGHQRPPSILPPPEHPPPYWTCHIVHYDAYDLGGTVSTWSIASAAHDITHISGQDASQVQLAQRISRSTIGG
jgi:hypothetical protein